jgi:hypothetical protein
LKFPFIINGWVQLPVHPKKVALPTVTGESTQAKINATIKEQGAPIMEVLQMSGALENVSTRVVRKATPDQDLVIKHCAVASFPPWQPSVLPHIHGPLAMDRPLSSWPYLGEALPISDPDYTTGGDFFLKKLLTQHEIDDEVDRFLYSLSWQPRSQRSRASDPQFGW